MRTVGYAYPWDVTEPGFVDRARALGVDEVAVAVTYHGARAATPWSTRRSAVHADHAALYRPLRPGAFGRLRPGVPDWVDDEDPARAAVAVLGEAGIPAAAWVVLLHDTRLGSAHRDLAVRNCFGETYPWALCPAHDEVRAYAATLAAEAVRDLDVGRVVLESCGQMGVRHQCCHDKTDGAWTPEVERLLSICCCAVCGTDPDPLRAAVVAARDPHDADADADAVARSALETRHAATDALRAEVVHGLGVTGERLVLHASPDPWATGALPGLTPGAAAEVDTVVVGCWDPATGVAAVAGASELTAEVGAYVNAAGPERLPDPGRYVAALRRAGATELHLYHLGLAGPARWADLEGAVRA